MKRIALISTGGTIEKTYDDLSGVLANKVSVLDVMLASLELRGVEIQRVALMNKDSLEMSPADHTLIAETATRLATRVRRRRRRPRHRSARGHRASAIVELAGTPASPIVLTGAMRPYELRATDALQNLTEALLAVQLLPPGVYVAMHNQVLRFPGVMKDRAAGHVREAATVTSTPSSARRCRRCSMRSTRANIGYVVFRYATASSRSGTRTTPRCASSATRVEEWLDARRCSTLVVAEQRDRVRAAVRAHRDRRAAAARSSSCRSPAATASASPVEVDVRPDQRRRAASRVVLIVDRSRAHDEPQLSLLEADRDRAGRRARRRASRTRPTTR